MWLKILRQNLSHLARRAKGSASIEQKNGSTRSNKTNNNGAEVNRNEDNQNGSIDPKSQAKKKPVAAEPGSGPLLQNAEISTSQLDFFKMLDEKIENGPDYDETQDATTRAERVSELMRRWELASMSWASVADNLNNSTYSLSSMMEPGILGNSRQSLTAKDREGMRNIIGGRPECAPVLSRNANRVDGLREIHSPSSNMPRHVLESITQSPTQSLKRDGSVSVSVSGDSPTSLRYLPDCANLGSSPRSIIGGARGTAAAFDEDLSAASSAFASSASRSRFNQSRNEHSNANGDFSTAEKAIYREQYLQRSGIITGVQSSSSSSPRYTGNGAGSGIDDNASGNSGTGSVGNSVTRNNNPYVQQFQLGNSSPQHFVTARKQRGFNTAQMT